MDGIKDEKFFSYEVIMDELHENAPYRFELGNNELSFDPADGSIRLTSEFVGGPPAYVLTDDELIELYEVLRTAMTERFKQE